MIIYLFLCSMNLDIIACLSNWENCAMWVQDAISLSTNIAAEITENEVDNFIRMCKVFAEHSECATSAGLGPSGRNAIQVANLMEFIENEISDLSMASRREVRNRFELEIVSTLEKYICDFDTSLKFYPFGSSQYGDRITNSNFNLLITTSKL